MMLYWTSCSVYYSTTLSTTMAVVPPRQRGVASSLLVIGLALGAALGFGAAVPLSDLAGGNWRFALLVFGLATLAVPIMLMLPKWPEPQPSAASFGGLTAIFHDRVLITLLVINLATSYTSSVLTVWGPSFLTAERGISPVEAGLYLALINLIGIPATSLGGILSDRINRHYLTLFLFLAASLSVAVLALLPAPVFVLGAVVAYGLFGKWTADAPLGAFLGDRLAARYPTMGSAICSVNNTARMTGTLLAPAVTGLLLDQTGTLASGLLLGAAVLVTAGLLFLFFRRWSDCHDHPTLPQEMPMANPS